MRTRSFFLKQLLGNLLLIALLVGVGGWIAYDQIDETYLAEGRQNQARTTGLLQNYIEHVWPEAQSRVERIDPLCKHLMTASPMRLTVIARDGRVLGDSEANPRQMENHDTPDRTEVLEALQGRASQAERASGTLGIRFRYLARPVREEGQVVGVVRVAMPIRTILASQAFIRNGLLWAGGAAVGSAGLLALLLSWIWYAPLRQITRTARTLAAGDLSQRAAVTGSDELAQLATALNEMRANISTQIDQIAAQRQNLIAVVDNLREGVLGLDRSGCILLANQSAIDLLGGGQDAVIGKHLQAVVRNAEIVGAYHAVFGGQGAIDRQAEADVAGKRHVFEVHAAAMTEGTGGDLAALLVVRDITHLVRMAAMKAEFVANASHELRTPLATIRAAVDSLASVEPGETAEVRRMADILDRHTRRLEDMTNDLLSLHLVESRRHKLRPEVVGLPALAEWVRDHFSRRAAEKGIALTTQTDQPDPDARLATDSMLVQLILQNLLDNALKFTPAGGSVACRFALDADVLTLSVTDSGCGIPAEIQDRVFERFFQANPARSGEPRIRGTGLGLAIVKHAAERLGASVILHSEPGKGTTLTVRIPPAQP